MLKSSYSEKQQQSAVSWPIRSDASSHRLASSCFFFACAASTGTRNRCGQLWIDGGGVGLSIMCLCLAPSVLIWWDWRQSGPPREATDGLGAMAMCSDVQPFIHAPLTPGLKSKPMPSAACCVLPPPHNIESCSRSPTAHPPETFFPPSHPSSLVAVCRCCFFFSSRRSFKALPISRFLRERRLSPALPYLIPGPLLQPLTQL